MPDKVIVISLDAMGGDHGPSVVVPAAVQRLEASGGRLKLILHGDRQAIETHLSGKRVPEGAVEIRHTDLVVAMDEKPAQALRRGKGSSLWNAIESVKSGQADAIVSAGNTGALMAISKLQLRMAVPDLERPAIVAAWPTVKGHTAVLDVGANVSSDAHQLIEFAIMGAAFHRAVLGSKNPSIGLLNVGSEDAKGHEEVREAHTLLRERDFGLNYFGFVEGTDIGKGTVDVIVTDGFTGNVALKTAEGTARFISGLMKDALMSSPLSRLGALLAAPALKKMRRRIDPSSINGGPLLGLNGIVVKSHGGADVRGFTNAIRVAEDLVSSGFANEIARNLERMSSIMSSPAAPVESRES
ncbi:phosphate acyltransferase PlsX [Brevundimonas sp. 2R-24]|uniref:Phosphate acyltransferase n=1 Tax=Peiella sedimenti TaxID=3061083 RepID=A0ABT8SJG2_9CAUL|nr:phosphate acyltransferase PlsX [Caulobacteraceae bacterium XZ-24]